MTVIWRVSKSTNWNGVAHILGLEHHLIRLGAHFRAFGDHAKTPLPAPHGGKRRWIRHLAQGAAHGSQGHPVAIRIRGKHVEGERLARSTQVSSHGRDVGGWLAHNCTSI